MAQFTQEFKKNALALLGTLTPTQIVEKLGISKTAFYRWKQQAEHPGKRKRKPGKKGASSKRKQYTDDVKQRAVTLVREGKLTQTEIAKSVGCSLFTLRVWCKEQGKKKDYTKPTLESRPYLAVGVRYKNLPPLFANWVANHTHCGKAGTRDTFSIFRTLSRTHLYALQRTFRGENNEVLYHEIIKLGDWETISKLFEEHTDFLAAKNSPEDEPAPVEGRTATATVPGASMDEYQNFKDYPPHFATWVSGSHYVGESKYCRMYKDTLGRYGVYVATNLGSRWRKDVAATGSLNHAIDTFTRLTGKPPTLYPDKIAEGLPPTPEKPTLPPYFDRWVTDPQRIPGDLLNCCRIYKDTTGHYVLVKIVASGDLKQYKEMPVSAGSLEQMSDAFKQRVGEEPTFYPGVLPLKMPPVTGGKPTPIVPPNFDAWVTEASVASGFIWYQIYRGLGGIYRLWKYSQSEGEGLDYRFWRNQERVASGTLENMITMFHAKTGKMPFVYQGDKVVMKATLPKPAGEVTPLFTKQEQEDAGIIQHTKKLYEGMRLANVDFELDENGTPRMKRFTLQAE